MTKEQSKKATKLLGLLCEKGNLTNTEVSLFFKDNGNEASFICEELEKIELIRVTRGPVNKIAGLNKTEKTCNEYKIRISNKKLIIKIFKKFWKIIVGIGIILGIILTVIQITDSLHKKETNSKKPKLIKESEKSNENLQNKDSINAQSDSLHF